MQSVGRSIDDRAGARDRNSPSALWPINRPTEERTTFIFSRREAICSHLNTERYRWFGGGNIQALRAGLKRLKPLRCWGTTCGGARVSVVVLIKSETSGRVADLSLSRFRQAADGVPLRDQRQ
jgi:hypothetical protein